MNPRYKSQYHTGLQIAGSDVTAAHKKSGQLRAAGLNEKAAQVPRCLGFRVLGFVGCKRCLLFFHAHADARLQASGLRY